MQIKRKVDPPKDAIYIAHNNRNDVAYSGSLAEINDRIEDDGYEVDDFDFYRRGDKVEVKLEKKLMLVEAI